MRGAEGEGVGEVPLLALTRSAATVAVPPNEGTPVAEAEPVSVTTVVPLAGAEPLAGAALPEAAEEGVAGRVGVVV